MDLPQTESAPAPSSASAVSDLAGEKKELPIANTPATGAVAAVDLPSSIATMPLADSEPSSAVPRRLSGAGDPAGATMPLAGPSLFSAVAEADLPSGTGMPSLSEQFSALGGFPSGNVATSQSFPAAMDLPNITPPRSLEERFSVLRSIAEECIEEDELLRLLQDSPNPICYDGFEPSGRMHIAQGVVKAININKMVSSGCKVKILVADWFAMLNKKLGGDLDKIRTVGRYMIEVWKALGVNVDAVEFLWSSEEIFKRPNEYWPLVMDIAQKRSINRIVRCCQIMGRSEKDDLTAAQFLYPLMQCADVFFLKVDICQLGMDQRKVNMLAREYAELSGKSKPIILSHHMLPGLKEGQQKMSKSDPSSAIFMEDDEAQINLKIKKAFCPIKIIEGNPCLEYVQHIILPWFGRFEVARKEANGGNKIYEGMEELLHDYGEGSLHPADVKPALAKAINKILQPVRDHFESSTEAKILLKTVKSYQLGATIAAE